MPATLETLRIPVTILHILAIGTTAFRLALRIRTRRFWWDDGWALFALILDFLYLLTFWLRNDQAASTPHVTAYIVLNWFTNVLGTAVLWAARISIVITINRLTSPISVYKRITAYMPIVFLLMWLAIQIEKIVVCTRTTAWHHTKSIQCMLGEPVPATELSLDVIADLILLLIPLRILTRMNLPRKTRRLMIYVFTTTILITLGNFVHIAFLFGSIKWATFILVAVSGHIESTIALMVCNLSVIVPAVHQFVSKGQRTRDEGEYNTTYWGSPTAMLGGGTTTHDGATSRTDASSVKDSEEVLPGDVEMLPISKP